MIKSKDFAYIINRSEELYHIFTNNGNNNLSAKDKKVDKLKTLETLKEVIR